MLLVRSEWNRLTTDAAGIYAGCATKNTSQFICFPANNGLKLFMNKCAQDVGFNLDFIQFGWRQRALA